MDKRFPKEERLKSKRLIDELFANGKSSEAFPLAMVYREVFFEDEVPIKVGFSVSKKRIYKAVDRNKVKRRMREAYRTNKERFIPDLEGKYALMLICITSEIPRYKAVEESVKKLLTTLLKGQR